MKKFMLMAVCLMMALSVVSCGDDGEDEEDMVTMAIVNAMNSGDASEAVFVSSAVGGSMDIIAELMPGGVTLNPRRVFVTGSFVTDEEIDVTSTVELPAGAFSATYQVRLDADDDCSDGDPDTPCDYETDITGVITNYWNLAKDKTYLVYFCNLADDDGGAGDSYDDGYTDYVKVFEYVDSWDISAMTPVAHSATAVACDDSSTGDCTGIGER